MDTSSQSSGPAGTAIGRILFGILFRWFFYRRFNQGDELDAEHPKWIAAGYPRDEQLEELAVKVATDIPDDAEAVAAIRSAASGKPKEWKVVAAWMRSKDYTWEHRNWLRAARLLKAAADGDQPVQHGADQEALFSVVERLETVPLAEAFAMLASEVPALSALEQEILTMRSRPGWQDTNAADHRKQIRNDVGQLVGPQASSGSPLIRSNTALYHALGYLSRRVGLLEEDNWGR